MHLDKERKPIGAYLWFWYHFHRHQHMGVGTGTGSLVGAPASRNAWRSCRVNKSHPARWIRSCSLDPLLMYAALQGCTGGEDVLWSMPAEAQILTCLWFC
jgi:hypothetical protein